MLFFFTQNRGLLLIVFFAFILFAPGLHSGYAQDSGTAYLQKGPFLVKKMSFVKNTRPSWEAEYILDEYAVAVYFTTEDFDTGEARLTDLCRENEVYDFTNAANPVLYTSPKPGWSLFFIFTPEAGSYCLFIDGFVERFGYFMDKNTDLFSIPFPAIIDVK